MLKRITTLLFCLFLIFVSIPFLGNAHFSCFSVYASSSPSGYTPITTDQDLVQSFNDYVKSRNANFTGSLPDATDIYILNLMNKGANKLNTNIQNIKNAIAKKSETGGRVIWYFDSTVTNFYNDLFDFLLQDLDLQVGDQANDTVYNGGYFIDDDNNACLMFVVNGFNNLNGGGTDTRSDYIVSYGSPLKYDSNSIIRLFDSGTSPINLSITSNDVIFTVPVYKNADNNYNFGSSGWDFATVYSNDYSISSRITNYNGEGFTTAILNLSDNKVYIGRYSFGKALYYSNDRFYYSIQPLKSNTSTNKSYENATINFVSIDNKTINNNNYEGDTYITNEGDVINNNPPGGHDPGWDVSGGQGTYDDGNGNTYNITFPDFELPDLNIDWSISGLGTKFPFSIPFDIASLVAVLNAEPEAPRFQGTMDFGITTYDYDIDLSQFDTVASACRIAELLLLVFGLIMITRSIIKG